MRSPLGTPSGMLTGSTWSCASLEAHSTMPYDMTSLILAGLRLHTTSTLRPAILSWGTNLTRPLITWRGLSSPTSISSRYSASALGCLSTLTMVPTRMSSIPMCGSSSSFLPPPSPPFLPSPFPSPFALPSALASPFAALASPFAAALPSALPASALASVGAAAGLALASPLLLLASAAGAAGAALGAAGAAPLAAGAGDGAALGAGGAGGGGGANWDFFSTRGTGSTEAAGPDRYWVWSAHRSRLAK
mmetsp:Transcript_24466/g.53453  ORF Transcript_24466/g.53453 Transcript_24466/m.53453 type:complete len:248 (-) Transcript_24466:410-1153(-)